MITAWHRIITFLVILLFLAPLHPASAQGSGAIYTVQEGDTLTSISLAFRTTTRDLLALNPMDDPNNLAPGKRLFIPGFEDLTGEIRSLPLPAGESARTLRRGLRQLGNLTERLNFLTSPDQLYAGKDFYYLYPGDFEQHRLSLTAGINAAELAVSTFSNPWLAAQYNDLPSPWRLLANDTLYLPASSLQPSSAYIPALSGMDVKGSTIAQGKTSIFQADAAPGVTISGTLLDHTLHFFPDSRQGLTALQGVPRMAEPGLYPLVVTASTADGRTFTHQQNLLLEFVQYGYDTPLEVADNVIDPAVTEPEFELLMELTADAPPEKLWSTIFFAPSPNPDKITSYYGRLREYNGSGYIYYHSGLDYMGSNTTPVLAPAPGIVTYTGELTVRGMTTIISHGWGVYTGYWHQSRIDVKVGDRVEIGQTIGMVGNTGRVTGPHLHFDLIVGQVEVDPEDWFRRNYVDL